MNSKSTKVIRNNFVCPVKWESMKGDEFVRFCDICKSKVYDLSESTDEEIIQFIEQHSGSVCGRIQMRDDEKVIHGQCTKGRVQKYLLGSLSVDYFKQNKKSK